MADLPQGPADPEMADPDVVEYLIVRVPELGALSSIASALAQLVQTGAIRVLDVVVIVRNPSELFATVLEREAVESLRALQPVDRGVGPVFSDHDIGLASLAVEQGAVALLLLVEDCWVEPLAAAARVTGGTLLSGERIPRDRVNGAVAEPGRQERIGRHQRGDLLARLPASKGSSESRYSALLVDPVQQLRELAHLLERGLVSREQFERQRSKVFDD